MHHAIAYFQGKEAVHKVERIVAYEKNAICTFLSAA